jgi:hypothetical protein
MTTWLDRLFAKTKKDSTVDPVGPVGGNTQPASPTETGPWVSPGNPGSTYAPTPNMIPSIDSQQTPDMYQGLPESPMVGDYPQQVLWPTEVTSYNQLSPAPFKDRGPDPRWEPEQFNPAGPVNGHISYSFNRPWRLVERLDGNRTFFEASDIPVPSTEGYVGLRTAPTASMFVEPAPWATNVLTTTQASGTPTSPGTAQNPVNIEYSSAAFPSNNNGSYRLM